MQPTYIEHTTLMASSGSGIDEPKSEPSRRTAWQKIYGFLGFQKGYNFPLCTSTPCHPMCSTGLALYSLYLFDFF